MRRERVERFFELFSNQDLDGLGPMLNEEAEFYFPKTEPLRGRERILRFFRILFRKFPELTFTVHRILSDGDQVAAHWTNGGRDRTGQEYQNEGLTLLVFEGEGLRLISDFFKDTEKF